MPRFLGSMATASSILVVMGGLTVMGVMPNEGSGENVAPTTSQKNDVSSLATDAKKAVPAGSIHGGFVVAELVRQSLAGQPSPPSEDPPTSRKENDWVYLLRNLVETARGNDGLESLEVMIQTVPDPLHTDLEMFCDAALDATLLGAAAGESAFLLDGFEMPWGLKDGKVGSVQPVQKSGSPVGVVLLRAGVAGNPASQQLLVILVVPETPTSGVDKQALTQALDVAYVVKLLQVRLKSPLQYVTDLFFANLRYLALRSRYAELPRLIERSDRFSNFKLGWKAISALAAERSDKNRVIINLLGPFFSGSSVSIATTIKAWWEPFSIIGVPHPGVEMRFVTGTAMADANQQILQACTGPNLISRFASTVLPIGVVYKTLLEYLKKSGVDSGAVAILSEADTAYGSSLMHVGPTQTVKQIGFPMHIGSMRAAYAEDAKLFLGKSNPADGAPRWSLDLSLKGTTEPRHLLPVLSLTTINQIEASLTAELRELYRRHIKAVIIVATDPRDQLFLSRLVKTHAPETQIILISSDTIFVHETPGVNLDDVLIASTYPLTPSLQKYSDGSIDEHVRQEWSVYRNSHAEGIYNAAVALIHGAVGSDPCPDGSGLSVHCDAASLLRDYRPPHWFQPKPGLCHIPPLWLTAVRGQQFWPLACLEPKPDLANKACKTARSIPYMLHAATSGSVNHKYDPGHFTTVAFVASLVAVWGIYRAAFYLRVRNWTLERLADHPSASFGSLLELTALTTAIGLLLAPFAIHSTLSDLANTHPWSRGDFFGLSRWAIAALLLILALSFVTCVTLRHAARIVAAACMQRKIHLPLGLCAIAAIPVAIATLVVYSVHSATIYSSVRFAGLLGIGLLTVVSGAACWQRCLEWSMIKYLHRRKWLIYAACGLGISFCIAQIFFSSWQGIFYDESSCANQAPITCDRFYFLASGVSPLAPPLVLMLGIAFFAHRWFYSALLAWQWGDVRCINSSAADRLYQCLYCTNIASKLFGKAILWSPFVAMVTFLLFSYHIHQVTCFDFSTWYQLMFGILAVTVGAAVVTAARFYHLSQALLTALSWLPAEAVGKHLYKANLPLKLSSELERLFFGADPTLIDITTDLPHTSEPRIDSSHILKLQAELAEHARKNCEGLDFNAVDELSEKFRQRWEESLRYGGAGDGFASMLAAILVTMQIRAAMCCMRKLFIGSLILSIAALVAIESYPFMPRGPLALAALSTPMLVFSIPLMMLFVRLSRDQVISHISGSDAQVVEFSGTNAMNLSLPLLLPVITTVVYQYPAFAKPLLAIRDILIRRHN